MLLTQQHLVRSKQTAALGALDTTSNVAACAGTQGGWWASVGSKVNEQRHGWPQHVSAAAGAAKHQHQLTPTPAADVPMPAAAAADAPKWMHQ